MGWVSRSNPALVEAIVASFSASREEGYTLLSPFTAEDWARTESWLDTSGLAFYFLNVIQTRRLIGAVDRRLVEKLQQKLAENKLRLAELLHELVALNQSFEHAGIRFANLKGFTLFPHSCPDLSLRHISDFDFLVEPADVDLAGVLLEQHGYHRTGSTAHSLEFKTAGRIRTSLAGQYQADNRRSAELHLAVESLKAAKGPGERDSRLNRLVEWECPAGRLPSLGPADQLIGQALHLLGHLRHEHTRASWLLEFRQHVRVRGRDAAFWQVVQARAEREPEIATALGLSTLLATRLFGSFAPPELSSWTVDALPPMVRLWVELYGQRAVLADVPGTKLYLLLEDALREARPEEPAAGTMRRLIPLRLPDRIDPAMPRTSLRERMRRELIELRFLIFRLRFHLREGWRYLVESHRWKRLRAGYEELREAESLCICRLHSR
ncbi:MAG: nucleotidyltransferase family protein [Acidobacteriota bacterium]